MVVGCGVGRAPMLRFRDSGSQASAMEQVGNLRCLGLMGKGLKMALHLFFPCGQPRLPVKASGGSAAGDLTWGRRGGRGHLTRERGSTPGLGPGPRAACGQWTVDSGQWILQRLPWLISGSGSGRHTRHFHRSKSGPGTFNIPRSCACVSTQLHFLSRLLCSAAISSITSSSGDHGSIPFLNPRLHLPNTRPAAHDGTCLSPTPHPPTYTSPIFPNFPIGPRRVLPCPSRPVGSIGPAVVIRRPNSIQGLELRLPLHRCRS